MYQDTYPSYFEALKGKDTIDAGLRDGSIKIRMYRTEWLVRHSDGTFEGLKSGDVDAGLRDGSIKWGKWLKFTKDGSAVPFPDRGPDAFEEDDSSSKSGGVTRDDPTPPLRWYRSISTFFEPFFRGPVVSNCYSVGAQCASALRRTICCCTCSASRREIWCCTCCVSETNEKHKVIYRGCCNDIVPSALILFTNNEGSPYTIRFRKKEKERIGCLDDRLRVDSHTWLLSCHCGRWPNEKENAERRERDEHNRKIRERRERDDDRAKDRLDKIHGRGKYAKAKTSGQSKGNGGGGSSSGGRGTKSKDSGTVDSRDVDWTPDLGFDSSYPGRDGSDGGSDCSGGSGGS